MCTIIILQLLFFFSLQRLKKELSQRYPDRVFTYEANVCGIDVSTGAQKVSNVGVLLPCCAEFNISCSPNTRMYVFSKSFLQLLTKTQGQPGKYLPV